MGMRVTIRKRVNKGNGQDGVQGEGKDKGKSKNDGKGQSEDAAETCVLASGTCKDKGVVRLKVDRCEGESEDDSESEGKRKGEAEVEIERGDS